MNIKRDLGKIKCCLFPAQLGRRPQESVISQLAKFRDVTSQLSNSEKRNNSSEITHHDDNQITTFKQGLVTRKRARENSIIDYPREVKQRKLEDKVQRNDSALYPEMWDWVASVLNSKDCVSLSFVSRYLFDVVHNHILTSLFWGDKLAKEYEESALKGEVFESCRVFNLLNCSCTLLTQSQFRSERSFMSFLDPIYPITYPLESPVFRRTRMLSLYPSADLLKSSVMKELKGYTISYNDQDDFLLNILLGTKRNVLPTNQDRKRYLDDIQAVCNGNITLLDNEYFSFHARKIIEYYIRHELNPALFKKTIQVLFIGIEYAMLTNDSEDINQWLNLLKLSFYLLDPLDLDLLYIKCIQLLKKQGSTDWEAANLEAPKNQILDLIRCNIQVYLSQGRTFVLDSLLQILRHGALHNSSMRIVENILCEVCEQRNIRFSYILIDFIIMNYLSRNLNNVTRNALTRIIVTAITQHGSVMMDKLLQSINEKLANSDPHKIGLRFIVSRVYEFSNDEVREIILNRIKGFIFNRLLVEHNFYKELKALVN
jgi:hypothetical protein